MTSRIGFVIGGSSLDRGGAVLIERLRKLKPAYVIMLDNTHLANMLVHETPETKIIYRNYWPQGGDDNLHTKANPRDWVDAMLGLGLDRSILWYMNNEPSDRIDALTNWTIAAMAGAQDRAGVQCVVGNWGVGHPEPEHWRNEYAPLLRWMYENPGHFLGLHEYWIADSPMQDYPYLLGRFRDLHQAEVELGIGRVPTIITEFGVGLDFQYRPMGWKNIKTSGWSQRAYARMLLQLDHNIYAPSGNSVLGQTVFYYGARAAEWSEFDVEGADEFWDEITSYTPTPSLEGAERVYMSSTGAATNVREEPNTTSKIVGRIVKDVMVFAWIDEADWDGSWMPIVFNGIPAWVHADYVTWTRPNDGPDVSALSNWMRVLGAALEAGAEAHQNLSDALAQFVDLDS